LSRFCLVFFAYFLFFVCLLLRHQSSTLFPYTTLFRSLMASANIPGDFLDRFDALWMVFLLFALLYSVGTVLFYSQHLISKNPGVDRKSTRLNSSHVSISYAVFCL